MSVVTSPRSNSTILCVLMTVPSNFLGGGCLTSFGNIQITSTQSTVYSVDYVCPQVAGCSNSRVGSFCIDRLGNYLICSNSFQWSLQSQILIDSTATPYEAISTSSSDISIAVIAGSLAGLIVVLIIVVICVIVRRRKAPIQHPVNITDKPASSPVDRGITPPVPYKAGLTAHDLETLDEEARANGQITQTGRMEMIQRYVMDTIDAESITSDDDNIVMRLNRSNLLHANTSNEGTVSQFPSRETENSNVMHSDSSCDDDSTQSDLSDLEKSLEKADISDERDNISGNMPPQHAPLIDVDDNPLVASRRPRGRIGSHNDSEA